MGLKKKIVKKKNLKIEMLNQTKCCETTCWPIAKSQ